MKNLVSTIILAALCTITHAQVSTEFSDRIDYNEKNGNIRISTSKDKIVSAKSLATDKAQLQLPTQTDLHLAKQTTDKDGFTHYRYTQHHAGVRVEGGNLMIHEKGGKAMHANGRLSKGLTAKKQLVFSEEQALQKAIGSFDAARFVWEMSASELPPQMSVAERSYPQAEIVWLPAEIWNVEQSCMAYKFDIFSIEPLKREWVYVNVETGSIELTISQIKAHNCFEATTCNHTENNNVILKNAKHFSQHEEDALAMSNYAGEVPIDTDFDGSVYTLKTNVNGVKVQTFNANNQKQNYIETPFTSSDNTWQDPNAVDVQWGLVQSYNYYYDVHERHSYDDEGSNISGWVHYGDKFSNAFSVNSTTGFGDGGIIITEDGSSIEYSSITSLDVVAHEFTHAVTEHTAGLAYGYESGALNESFSDIFGALVEHYYHPNGNDWIVGTGVLQTPGINGIRNLANPKDPQMTTQQPDTYLGEYWYEEISDPRSLHINSGVQNYWFYLLANGGVGINDNNFAYDIEGVGLNVATDILYRMLGRLSPNATYEEARTVSIQIAQERFEGDTLLVAERTAAAWCAVGVGNDCMPDISCAVRDSLALLELYEYWDPQAPMDTWSGVVLDENRCVSSVVLHNVTNGVDDFPISLSLLSELKVLHLVGCDLTGHIPPELGQLSQLERLALNGNALTGTLPVELANLTNLKQLWCSGNNLSGTLPPEYGQLTNLTEMSFGSNNFSGTLPAEWANLDNLLYLTLSENSLSGALPVEWANMDTLTILQAKDNFLSGEIPQEYTELDLFALILQNNQFYGTLPDFSGVALSIYGNRFTFAGLEGNLSAGPTYAPQAAIPLLRDGNELSIDAGGSLADNTYEWYKDDILFATITGDNTLIADTPGIYRCAVTNAVLTNPNSIRTNLIIESTSLYVDPRPCALRDSLMLVELYNNTNGPNWVDSWDLTQPMNTWQNIGINAAGCVDAINLSHQEMSGALPDSIYHLSELRNFLFYDNPQLGDTISTKIANLTKLEMFSISSCNFSGPVPDVMGQLTQLEHFSIGGNNFTGTFPEWLLNLTELDKINIAQNNFTGELPIGFANLTKLEYLSIHNNDFTDTIPEDIADIPSLTKFYAYSNDFVSPLPAFSDSMEALHIRYNNFNFDDIMNNIHLSGIDIFYYNRQAKIPIYTNGNALYVNAGGDMADNTYTWYKDNNLVAVITGDNYYIPAIAGEYRCEVTNATVTNTNAPYQDLILESETYSSSNDLSPVYPGDMDNNGVVNNYDALYWGLSNGFTGYVRPNATTDWTAQPSADWVATFDGVNAKHQDADGNKEINEADFDVIKLNYGKTHGNSAPGENNSSPNSLHAEIDSIARNGNQVTLTIKISLKNNTMTPISTHGLAFDLDYQPAFPVDSILSVGMNLNNSWLTGGNESSLKTITNIDHDNNRLSFGITRGDRQNMIGFGEIGTAIVIVCDDIHMSDSTTTSRIIVNNGSSMSANRIITPLTGNIYELIHQPNVFTCAENDDNTLLFLPFDESPNGLSGETPTQADLTYDTGIFDQAAYVNGMTFSTADNLNTDEGTLEVWVKPSWNGNDGQSHVILQAGASGGMLMEKDGGSYLKIILNRWASQGQPEVGIGYNVAHWQAGEWQHIAYTWGNGEILMYVNGTIVASKNYTNLPPLNVSEFNIGRDYDGNKTWDGLMDELRISDIVRTPQEIMDAVDACAPTPEAPLTCIDNDDSSLLVLPFEDNPNGLSGETPMQEDLTYSTGIFGQAANLSVGSNGLTFSATNNLNTDEGTFEVWVKPLWDGNDGQSHVILQAGVWGGMLMEKDGGSYLKIILNRWGGANEIGLGYNVAHWEAGQWQHIAYTWGNGQVCMYVNGTPVDCKTNINIPELDVSEFNIGKDYWGGNTWDGLMDELRISNIARTPQQIADAVANCSTELRYQQRLEVDIRNYPNPFAEYTTIEFELLEDNPTTVQVFDIKGSPVATVLNERKTMGKHKVVFNAENLPAGVYYYMIRSGEYFGSKNMIIIR